MTLVERTQTLRTLVTECSLIRARMEESKTLQARMAEAEKILASLETLLESVRLFRSFNIGSPVAPPASLNQARKRVSKVLERFRADAKSTVLTKSQDWNKLVDDDGEIAAAVKTIREHLETSWRTYGNEINTLTPPAEIEGSLARTENNDAAFKRYRKAYSEFNTLIKNLPKTEGDISKVLSVLELLRKTYAEFDFDVPEDVKRFLAAVGQNGANLDLLTEVVRAWLQGQGSYHRYRIITR